MNDQPKWVNGLRVFKPSQKSPEFIKANLSINKKEFQEWLKDQPDEILVDVKESKKGTWYCEVSKFKINGKKSNDYSSGNSKFDESTGDLPF